MSREQSGGTKRDAVSGQPTEDSEARETGNAGEEAVSGDARTVMIRAVEDATDAGAFPTVLVTIAPRSDGEPGSQVGVRFDRGNDREFIISLLRRAVDEVIGEEIGPKISRVSEEKLSQIQDWTRVIVNLVDAGKTPHAVIAVGEDGESVEAVTSLAIDDVPAFLRDAAQAVEEGESTAFMDLTAQ